MLVTAPPPSLPGPAAVFAAPEQRRLLGAELSETAHLIASAQWRDGCVAFGGEAARVSGGGLAALARASGPPPGCRAPRLLAAVASLTRTPNGDGVASLVEPAGGSLEALVITEALPLLCVGAVVLLVDCPLLAPPASPTVRLLLLAPEHVVRVWLPSSVEAAAEAAAAEATARATQQPTAAPAARGTQPVPPPLASVAGKRPRTGGLFDLDALATGDGDDEDFL